MFNCSQPPTVSSLMGTWWWIWGTESSVLKVKGASRDVASFLLFQSSKPYSTLELLRKQKRWILPLSCFMIVSALSSLGNAGSWRPWSRTDLFLIGDRDLGTPSWSYKQCMGLRVLQRQLPHPTFPFILGSPDIWPSMEVQVRATNTSSYRYFLLISALSAVFESDWSKKTWSENWLKNHSKSLRCQLDIVRLDLLKQSNSVYAWL